MSSHDSEEVLSSKAILAVVREIANLRRAGLPGAEALLIPDAYDIPVVVPVLEIETRDDLDKFFSIEVKPYLGSATNGRLTRIPFVLNEPLTHGGVHGQIIFKSHTKDAIPNNVMNRLAPGVDFRGNVLVLVVDGEDHFVSVTEEDYPLLMPAIVRGIMDWTTEIHVMNAFNTFRSIIESDACRGISSTERFRRAIG